MEMLGLEANVTVFDQDKLEIQVIFENPLSLSVGSGEPDSLRIQFVNTEIFVGSVKKQTIALGTTIW